LIGRIRRRMGWGLGGGSRGKVLINQST